jgi:hypothetical protein
MEGDQQDVLFFCGHCGSGALLEIDALRTVESTALLPASGRSAGLWKPAWVIETEVSVRERIRSDGRPTQGWQGEQTFVIPAYELGVDDLVRLARALSHASGDVGEVPREPIRGGILALDDAVTLARYIVVGEEVRKPDMLASVQAEVTLNSYRLAAIPFEKAKGHLRCAVTGVTVRAPALD